jgi:diadenosine tetraphosphatase ApaH/serine/threonine PP2A family protein phosphatase
VNRLRVGVISDVHSNLPALEAVLESIDAAAPDEIWCLGDVVGYGAQPDRCTTLVREVCAVSLNGNHDLAVTGAIDAATFSETARAAVDWTRANAAPATIEYLEGLAPEGAREGFGLFHASPRDPIWEYVLSIDQAEAGLDAQKERICLIGHSHVSLFFTRPPSTGRKSFATGAQSTDGDLLELAEGEWLLNPGSVGQPRDGDARAAWLSLDLDALQATYHRVPYDIAGAAAAIRAARLPDSLAERLEYGQ